MKSIKTPSQSLFGARSEHDLLYSKEFEQLSRTHDAFSFITVLSKASEYWFGKTGYVQAHLKEYLAKQDSVNSLEFYLCGPPVMMSVVESLLAEFDVTHTQIFKDEFSRQSNS